MTNIRSGRSSALAALLDDHDDEGPAKQDARPEPQQVRAPLSQRGGAGPGLAALRPARPTIRAIDIWANGDPVMIQPEGLLVRWPHGELVPKVGDEFEGAAVHVTRREQREALVKLVRGNVLERCEAADQLPARLVKVFYSPPQRRNMRRVARNLCPSLRNHVARLLASGIRVSLRVLIKVVARTDEAEQWARYRAFLV